MVPLAGLVQADDQIPSMVHQLSPICTQSWLDHTYPENKYQNNKQKHKLIFREDLKNVEIKKCTLLD